MNDNKEKIEIKYKSALPVWAAAAVWIVFAVFFPMYKLQHYIFAALLSIIAAVTVWKIKPYYTELVDAPPVRSNTGNADLDTVIDGLYDAAGHLSELEKTAGSELSLLVKSIRETIKRIAEDLKNDPSDLKQCRRLLNYYIPTVIKLADKYVFLSKQPPDTKTVAGTMNSIEGAFLTIDDLLKKQLDALFENDALDISTDITVLEAMLSRDGIE